MTPMTETPPRDGDASLIAPYESLSFFLNLNPPQADFRADALAVLSGAAPSLSPKYLYDAKGSALFERITELEEYYPTRAEQAIVADNAAAISAAIGPNRAVFEYGSGASEKIKRLIGLMEKPSAYVALDISCEHLLASSTALAGDVDVPVGAICADFTSDARPPAELFAADQAWLGYFPGSTLGNLSDDEAIGLLNRAAAALGPGARFLVGVDLAKDEETLRLAYDDPAGVSAEFNLNLLRRMRRELDAEIEVDAFVHDLTIAPSPQRVEMRLRAIRDTEIRLPVSEEAGAETRAFAFPAGAALHTETSRKYDLEAFDAFLAPTPWRAAHAWTDPRRFFAVCLLERD
ncbi:MAG: L-histidine N(alpha)-methyltransferase [Parvularculaceae bacterium]